jgi:type II secretory pathway predicted ATPase ExeA
MIAKPIQAIEEWLPIWGLKRVPFTADEKGLFISDSHGQIIDALNTAALLRTVILLTGLPGTGKSSLLKYWLSGLDQKRTLPILITQASLSASGVLEMLLSKLGLRPAFKRSANLIALERHLKSIDPTTLILVLDDAQNYPAPALEEIRMLLGMGNSQRSAFSLVLSGEDYLLGSLQMSAQQALFSRISLAVELKTLTAEEIQPYLLWHVSHAGLNKDIFATAAIDLLRESSSGNPRTLNLLAQCAWMCAARLGGCTIEGSHVLSAINQVPSAKAKIDPQKLG